MVLIDLIHSTHILSSKVKAYLSEVSLIDALIYGSSVTPCNVVRDNRNYANEILMGASGHKLQTIDRLSTNLLSHCLLISERENRQLGSVRVSIVFISIQD